MPGGSYKKAIKPALALLLSLAILRARCPPYAGDVESVSVRSAPAYNQATALDTGMVRVYLFLAGRAHHAHADHRGQCIQHQRQTSRSLAKREHRTIGLQHSNGARSTLTQNGQTTNMGRAFSLKRHSTRAKTASKDRAVEGVQLPLSGRLSLRRISKRKIQAVHHRACFSMRTTCTAWLRAKWGNSTGLEALKSQPGRRAPLPPFA